MTVANTLAYYVTATITAVKCFIVLAPGGLSFSCQIALPEMDAFVITGGEIYNFNG